MLTAALLAAAAWQLIPGEWRPNQAPDGNSVLIDAPAGLILIDTGRHPLHQDVILAAARARGKHRVPEVRTAGRRRRAEGPCSERRSISAAQAPRTAEQYSSQIRALI